MPSEPLASTNRPSPAAPQLARDRAGTADTLGASPPSLLAHRYQEVRRFTDRLCDGLETEDFVVQSMQDVSPTKWHLAHTSWFFETFVLQPNLSGYRPIDPAYAFLFNSYYVHAGERHCRAQRGYISRPTVEEVFRYRRYVDQAMERLLESCDGEAFARIEPLVTLGINHEQQHQELMLTDIKHVFSVNPLRPAYRLGAPRDDDPAETLPPALRWIGYEGGLVEIGHDGEGFAYDNEGPRHRAFVQPFQLADRLVTNAEYLEFMEDGGYERADLWLSLGWAARMENGWCEPFYWEKRDGDWWSFTLSGMRPIAPAEPVAHLTYFEADAFARWAGARLPTEEEWELAATGLPIAGNLVESWNLHPIPADAGGDRQERPNAKGDAPRQMFGDDSNQEAPRQMYGDLWEWTGSPYSPYPGYRPAAGALGEYNGKFMCNQYVLRGGSCATSRSHIRPTYRNFFPPDAAWQFTGVRLARDA